MLRSLMTSNKRRKDSFYRTVEGKKRREIRSPHFLGSSGVYSLFKNFCAKYNSLLLRGSFRCENRILSSAMYRARFEIMIQSRGSISKLTIPKFGIYWMEINGHFRMSLKRGSLVPCHDSEYCHRFALNKTG